MQNTGQSSEKKSYRVILLLVVGLAAFSSAMKELNQVRDLTLQTSRLIAQWSEAIAPTEQSMTLAKVETCDKKKILLPTPPPVPPAPVIEAPAIVAPPLVPPTPRRIPAVPVKPKRVVTRHDSAEVRVLISTEDLVEKSLKDALEADVTLKALKAKNWRQQIWISSDGKDVILKSLHRGINLRSAS